MNTPKIKYPYPYNLLYDICDYFRDKENMADEELDLEQIKGIKYALSTLTEREQDVLSLRYEDCLTLEEIGDRYDITRERIRQIAYKGLRKLRHPSRWNYIRDGYEMASGAIAKKLWERYAEHYMALKEEYDKRIKEFEQGNAAVMEESVLDKGIEFLDLSIRSYNCMWRHGCRTIGAVCELTEADLCKVRNLGRKSIEEIIGALKKYGLRLKEDK